MAAAEPLPQSAERVLLPADPLPAISDVFLLKISTNFALNLAGGRLKLKVQSEGSRVGSLSLHGWALNTCDADTSVSCGPESCFSFVEPQMLQLWEKNKNAFPLEWLSGRRLQRWEEHTCHGNCQKPCLTGFKSSPSFFYFFNFLFSDSKVCFYAYGDRK